MLQQSQTRLCSHPAIKKLIFWNAYLLSPNNQVLQERVENIRKVWKFRWRCPYESNFRNISRKTSLDGLILIKLQNENLQTLLKQFLTSGVFMRTFQNFQNSYSVEQQRTTAFVTSSHLRHLIFSQFNSIYDSKSHDCNQPYIMCLPNSTMYHVSAPLFDT